MDNQVIPTKLICKECHAPLVIFTQALMTSEEGGAHLEVIVNPCEVCNPV